MTPLTNGLMNFVMLSLASHAALVLLTGEQGVDGSTS